MALRKKDITKGLLEKVATDINEGIGLEDKDKILIGKAVAKDLIQMDIIEVGKDLQLGEPEKLTEQTLEVLAYFGVKLPVAEEGEAPDPVVPVAETPVAEETPTNEESEPAVDAGAETPEVAEPVVDPVVDPPTPKKAAKKKAAAAKVPETPVVKKTGNDEFGFRIGSRRNLFAEAIKAKPLTMAEIKTAKWNDKGDSFYNAWHVIENTGKGKKDGKTMSVVADK